MNARPRVRAKDEAASSPGQGAEPLELARIGSPHGLRGELRVKLHNPSSDLLASLAELTLILPDGTRERRRFRAIKPQSAGYALLALEGCNDRDAAEALRGARVCVDREQLPSLPEGEHYLVDLIGLEARLPNGRKVGEVIGAIEYPAASVLSLRVEGGVIELPLIPPYLVELQPGAGFITVDDLDDLELQPAPTKHSG